MVMDFKPIFKYLYSPKEFSDYEFFLREKNIDNESMSILKDFNNFLTIYHRISQEEVEALFNVKISNEIKFLCVKAIIDFTIENSSDEEIVEYFGGLVYDLIKELCIQYEYPIDRTEKYANLYKNVYKHDISFFLKNE
jgi:hypothetical protein